MTVNFVEGQLEGLLIYDAVTRPQGNPHSILVIFGFIVCTELES